MMSRTLLTATLCLLTTTTTRSFHTPPPPTSRATGLPNLTYDWRGEKIRYQVSGDPATATQSVVLVHGLFVNADHWRKTLKALEEDGTYLVYALDLLGSGYSSKPDRNSAAARALNGENGRFGMSSTARDVTLGTANGGDRVADVELRHPLDSCYNFYTWSEQICDFTAGVVLKNNKAATTTTTTATLVCNSIGTISSLQAVLDKPDLFDGVFVVSPNFRELHVAEVPLPDLAMPVVRSVQRLLRDRGQPLFDALAKPDTVRKILEEPYQLRTNLDDELVDVLLTPLLTRGASQVVFDTLSYSAGPLPEQQLTDPNFADRLPVWVCYGDKDPWTPGKRVEELVNRSNGHVKRVVSLPGVGHCPHDEAPEMVHPLLREFLQTLA